MGSTGLFNAELEDIKSDMSILGTRLCAAISQNESLSEIEINLLRLKQKELESVIRRQHQEIYRLNKDNLFFKSRTAIT